MTPDHEKSNVEKNQVPEQLFLALIDEDPNQPRTVFNQEALDELAETIRLRGVKTPISVRPHPKVEGRYLINHGARRYRASIMAGKETIPAFVDNDYTEEDQIIENLQRENLTAKELAAFMGKLLAKGKTKQEIARAIGKSQTYVIHHVALLDLPDPVAEVFESGRCSDVTVVNDLVTELKRNPQETRLWIEDKTQEITRSTVRAFRAFLKSRQTENETEKKEDIEEKEPLSISEQPVKEVKAETRKANSLQLQVELYGRTAILLLHKRSSTPDRGCFKFEDNGEEKEAPLADAHLKAFVERG